MKEIVTERIIEPAISIKTNTDSEMIIPDHAINQLAGFFLRKLEECSPKKL